MSQPVKLSDSLVLDARLAGDVMERSIAGQVEFWARLGRSVERVLNGDEVQRLRKDTSKPKVSAVLDSLGTPAAKARVMDLLDSEPFPRFLPVAGERRLFERVDEDGTRTIGRFVKRAFVPVTDEMQKS